MKHAVDMGSVTMVYVPSFIQKLLEDTMEIS